MPPAVGYAIAGIATGAGLFGAAKAESGAATKAARTQTDAAKYAADLELEATSEAERFARQQAQAQWADAEAARRANYDQWAARQTAMNAFRTKYGFDPTVIPAYTPSADPRFVVPDPPSVYDTLDRRTYQRYQQEHPEALLSPEEWSRQFGGATAPMAQSGAPPRGYTGPTPDSWRPKPRRRPGNVGSYAGRRGGSDYQYAVMSVGDYLQRRR